MHPSQVKRTTNTPAAVVAARDATASTACHTKHNHNDNDDDDGGEALGSGLAQFFSDFLPRQTDVNGEPIGFSTKLSQVPTTTDPAVVDANFIQEKVVGVKYIEGGLSYGEWRTNDKNYLTEYLTRRLLTRSEEDGDETSSESSDEYNAERETTCMEPESQQQQQQQQQQLAMETQEKFGSPEHGRSVGDAKWKTRRRRRRRRGYVPHITECLHDLTKLEYLDLNTRTLSLNLSRIDSIWMLRETRRRGAYAKRFLRKPVFQHTTGVASGKRRSHEHAPQQIIFEERQEDGPAAQIYKRVIHFDVEQLHGTPTGVTGGVVGGPNDFLPSSISNNGREGQRHYHHHHQQQQQRIKVFLYNSYALAFSRWIKQQQLKNQARKKNRRKGQSNDSAPINTTDTTTHTSTTTDLTDVVMSFSNVPAICVFPRNCDPRNWRERQELVEYCLCIGDKSTAKHTTRKRQQQEQNGTGDEHICFDSDEMEIRLMSVVRKTTTTRTITREGSGVRHDTTVDLDASSELVLSRRTLEKEFPSSREGSMEELRRRQRVEPAETNADETTSPLQQSWDIYYQSNKSKHAGMNTNGLDTVAPASLQNPSGAATISSRQSTSQRVNMPPIHERNQRDETLSQAASHHGGREKSVEPMVFEGGAQRVSGVQDKSYLRLADISDMVRKRMDAGKGCNLSVNLYACVQCATPPKMTKRGDWMVSATLIDDSCQTPMTINIFCKERKLLPELVWIGDVIRIHRAVVEIWHEKIQLQGLKATQYIVVRKIRSEWQVHPTALSSFTFNQSDEERSQALWRWAKEHSKEHPSIKPEHCFTLSDFQQQTKEVAAATLQHRDITVMVVDKFRYQSSSILPQGLLRVWDGTGRSHSDPLLMQSSILAPGPGERRGMAQTKALEQVMRASQQLQFSVENLGVPISLCGCTCNVVVWEKAHWDLIDQHIPVGTFLRLRNVTIPDRLDGKEIRSIFLKGKSWMIALPTDNFEVSSLLYHHYERVCQRKNGATHNVYGNDCEYNPEFGGGGGGGGALFAPSSRCGGCGCDCGFGCGSNDGGCVPNPGGWVGNGLSRFRNRETPSTEFTGVARVLFGGDGNCNCNYNCNCNCNHNSNYTDATLRVVTVADRSGTIQAMATESVRRRLVAGCDGVDGGGSGRTGPGSAVAVAGSTHTHTRTRRFLVTLRMFVPDGDGDGDGKPVFVLTRLAPMD